MIVHCRVSLSQKDEWHGFVNTLRMRVQVARLRVQVARLLFDNLL